MLKVIVPKKSEQKIMQTPEIKSRVNKSKELSRNTLIYDFEANSSTLYCEAQRYLIAALTKTGQKQRRCSKICLIPFSLHFLLLRPILLAWDASFVVVRHYAKNWPAVLTCEQEMCHFFAAIAYNFGGLHVPIALHLTLIRHLSLS